MKRDRKWWVIEQFNYATQEWENIQGRYAYRAETSVMHEFLNAVAIMRAYMLGFAQAGSLRLLNKKTGRIISSKDLLCVRIMK